MIINRIGPIRTALFVPGTRPERVDKAVIAGADMVIIDLEDSVSLALKVETRHLAKEKVLEHAGHNIAVRVNALGSGYNRGDLETVVIRELDCIMLPKVETPEDLQEVQKRLIQSEKNCGLQPGTINLILLIESAKGVQNIFRILSERIDPERPLLAAFGAADYCLDMGLEITLEGTELLYPRSKIAVTSRAAGLAPPLDTPFMIDLKDLDKLTDDALRAKQLGFQGKLCIHPNQVGPCNEIFSPTEEEIRFSRKVVEAFEQSEAQGVAAIQLEGKFIDYPVVERSRRILRLASLKRV